MFENGNGLSFETKVIYLKNLYISVFQYSQKLAIPLFRFPEKTTITQFTTINIKTKLFHIARTIPVTTKTRILNHASFLCHIIYYISLFLKLMSLPRFELGTPGSLRRTKS